jgi:hypothetical protein
MKKKINKMKVLNRDFFLIIVCFILLFTPIRAFFPIINTLVVLLAGCMFVSFYAQRYFRSKMFLCLMAYFVVILINYASGDEYFPNIGKTVEEFAILFFSSILTYYIFTHRMVKMSRQLIFVVFFILVYFSVSTYMIESEYPGIVRNAVVLANEGDSQLTEYYLMGMVNYQLPHALPILTPAIVMNFRECRDSKIVRVLLAVVMIAVVAIIYMSYSATALIMFALALALSLMVRKDSLKNNIIRLSIVAFFALPIILSVDFWLSPIIQLFSTTESTVYFDRLIDIQNLTSSGQTTGDISSRQKMYEKTFSVLGHNVFIGSNSMPGGHSAIFDRLACLGLVGWIPYLLFICYQVQFEKRQMNRHTLSYYAIGIFVGIMMLLMKNMSNWEVWFIMFILMPLMLWLPNQKKSNTI